MFLRAVTLLLAGLLTFGSVAAAGGLRVVDGDTFYLDGEKIRIINIDTPETWRSRCADEYAVGLLAKERLGELLGSGEIVVVREGLDYWKRTLAWVYVNEVDVGLKMIEEGLALPYVRGPKAKAWRLQQWCALR